MQQNQIAVEVQAAAASAAGLKAAEQVCSRTARCRSGLGEMVSEQQQWCVAENKVCLACTLFTFS
jgi:hypothetical protein